MRLYQAPVAAYDQPTPSMSSQAPAVSGTALLQPVYMPMLFQIGAVPAPMTAEQVVANNTTLAATEVEEDTNASAPKHRRSRRGGAAARQKQAAAARAAAATEAKEADECMH